MPSKSARGNAANYLARAVSPLGVPQSEALTPKQVKNNAGGFVFEADPMARVRRFLILGSEGGSYYAREATLTRENAAHLIAQIERDGKAVVQEIVAISDAGRAPKNDPAIFALALCAASDNLETRQAAFAALPKVCRIGTHLFHFTQYVLSVRKWGRGLRSAVANWYLCRPEKALANQVVKYAQRDGWGHADLVRLSHPKPDSATREEIFRYATRGWESVGEEPHPDAALRVLWAAERAKLPTTAEKDIVRLITDEGLPMEAIPSEKRTAAVYAALLNQEGVGLTWVLRNLGNLSKAGVLTAGEWSAIQTVTKKITNTKALKAGRIHPLAVLVALNTYSKGKGVRGSGEWPVVPEVVDALNRAFYLAFDAVKPTGKRFVLGIDVSGSMTGGQIAGMPGITPNVGAAAMAMVTKRTEPYAAVMGFCHEFRDLGITASDSLDAVQKKTQQSSFGGTDCAQPMLWALRNKIKADAFVVYTDSETWAGKVHPVAVLREYRRTMNIPDARLIVVGMVANKFTIADPSDPGMLDIVGFDTAAPALMAEFVRGTI